MNKILTIFLLSILMSFESVSQQIQSTMTNPNPVLLHPFGAPPNPNAIDIIIMGDGYRYDPGQGIDDQPLFEQKATNLAGQIIGDGTAANPGISPFCEYRNYFNIWRVNVKSTDVGTLHPQEFSGFCLQTPSTNTDPPDTYFKTTLDAFGDQYDGGGNQLGDHRLLYPDPFIIGDPVDPNPTITPGLENIVINLDNDFNTDPDMAHVIMIVNVDNNTNEAWGSGGGDPSPFKNLATTYKGNHACSIVTHEYGHSFGLLRDEYWSGVQYAVEAANMYEHTTGGTAQCEDTPWEHWCGLEGIDITAHPGGVWHKPTNGVCKMEVLGTAPYCAVCREAMVMRIHDLLDPIISHEPIIPTIQATSSMDPLWIEPRVTTVFNGTVWIDANTLEYTWFLNGVEVSAWEGLTSVTPLCSDLNNGDNTITVEVTDNTMFTYIDENLVETPGSWVLDPTSDRNLQTITWTITAPTELYVSDNTTDGPLEENPLLEDFWSSPDIWVVNANGVIGNPVSNTTAQVKVLVTNHGCAKYEPNTGGTEPDQIDVRWAKASTALSWENNWDGNWTIGAALMGAPLSPIMLNVPIDAGQSVELSTNWSVPDQADYASIFGSGNPDVFFDEADHFCLLARIVVPDDAMNDEWPDDATTWNLSHNVKYNNNIALRNVVVVDPPGAQGGNYPDDHIVGGAVYLGNPTTVNGVFDLEFNVPKIPIGNPITKEAEIKLTFDNETFQNWVDAGQQGDLIEVSRVDRNQVIIKGDHAKMYGIPFSANKIGGLHVSLIFLLKNLQVRKSLLIPLLN